MQTAAAHRRPSHHVYDPETYVRQRPAPLQIPAPVPTIPAEPVPPVPQPLSPEARTYSGQPTPGADRHHTARAYDAAPRVIGSTRARW